MPSDPPTDPGIKIPKPGVNEKNEHIGAHGELVLPDVVPIVVEGHTGRFGLLANEGWIRTNYFMRGVAGTMAEWFTFVSSVASTYPKVAIILLVVAAVTAEEKFSEQPMFTNLVKYLMQSYDPDAAEKIFAEKPVDPDPIGKAAKKVTDEATKEFMESADYRLLKDEIEQDVNRQIRRQAYVSAGMTADVEALDQEILEAREARRLAREAKAAEENPPKEEEHVPTSHIQGTSLTPREPEPAPEPVAEPEVVPVENTEPVPAERKEGAGKRRSQAERVLDEVERLAPPLPLGEKPNKGQ